MNGIQVFTSPEFGEIRTALQEGAPWFVGKDVAAALGYSNTRKAIADHVDPEDKGVTKRDTLGGAQRMTVINESGLYSLILSSQLPAAKKFKRWVTAEVLPAIRQTGAYATPAADLSEIERRLSVLEAALAVAPAPLALMPRPCPDLLRLDASAPYAIRTNPQSMGREVTFARKPSRKVRAALKLLGLRWNPTVGCWFGYATEDQIATALNEAVNLQ